MKKLSFLLSLVFISSFGFAQAATVLFPIGGGTGTSTAPTYGKVLVGNAGGTYTLTATSSLGFSSLGSLSGLIAGNVGTAYAIATSTLTPSSPLTGSFIQMGSAGTLGLDTTGAWAGNAGTATALFANGANCTAGNYPLGVDASGAVENCTALTASGAFEIATTSTIAVPQLAYFTQAGGRTTLGGVSTTTLTTSGALSFSQPVTIIGASASALALDTSGTWTGTAATVTTNANMSGAVTSSGSNVTAFGTLGQGVLGNPASAATIPTALATSTLYAGANGQVLTRSAGTWIGVATTTFTGTAPISLSYAAGQVTGSCTTASSGVTGCLSGTNWDTFNNKQATISATFPIILSGAALSFGGISTSSPLAAASGLLYATGVNTVASVSTSSAVNMSITGNAATVTTNANLSGAVVSSGSNATTFGSQSAGVLGTAVAGVPTMLSTSTLYGAGISGQFLIYDTGAGKLAWVGTSTPTAPITFTPAGGYACATCLTALPALSGAVTSNGSTAVTAFGTLAQGILGNPASAATIPTALSTSTLYGVAPAGGYVLGWDNITSKIQWMATSSSSGSNSLYATSTLTGTNDGSNAAFTAANSPFAIFVNGVRQSPFTDYDVSGTTVTFTTAPFSGASLLYEYTTLGTGVSLPLSLSNGGTGASLTGTAGWLPYFDSSSTMAATSSIFIDTARDVGIGSTTPWAKLSISDDGGSFPLFAVATATNQGLPNFMIDSVGHIVTSGMKPLITACGAGSPTITGNDMDGKIVTGTAPTYCLITFNQTFTSAPACTLTAAPATVTRLMQSLMSSTSATTMQFMAIATSTGTAFPTMPAYTVSYHCVKTQ
jgi:hypothetical protein